MLAKKKKIPELKEGDFVDDVFFVKFKKGMNSYQKGFYFELTLSDNSGRNIDYKYWGNNDEQKVKSLYDSIKADSIVQVTGKVGIYKEKLQLAANEPATIKVLEEGQYIPSDFIKSPKKDTEQLYSQLLESIILVENPQLRQLLSAVFEDEKIKSRFKTHPGAIEIHHDWIGGLLEHALEVLDYCKLSWQLFPHLNKDLLIAGALLHDIGKLEEIGVTSRIKGTNQGQLVGHLVLGVLFVSQQCERFKLEEEVKSKLLHIITSHHGKLESGSPREPMFPEAVVIHYADQMSSKVTEMSEFIKDAKLSTEDDFMFHKRSSKNIFLK